MILIGMYDSPFVRRVGVALQFYDLPFEHRPWSVFQDLDKLAEVNPLRRVPTLVLDDGEVLSESGAILDYLDEMVSQDRALIARSGPARRAALRTAGIASLLCDKLVSILYERRQHGVPSTEWIHRCKTQVIEGLDLLERERTRASTSFWVDETITHADVATTCMMGFLRDAHAGTFDPARWPRLVAHAEFCEALPPFREIRMPFFIA